MVNLRFSDSKVIFDQGEFDKWCVYMTPSEAANNSRGQTWRRLDEQMQQRGF